MSHIATCWVLSLIRGCCGLKGHLGDFYWQWGEGRNGNCGAVDEGESFFSDSIDSMKGLCGKFKKKKKVGCGGWSGEVVRKKHAGYLKANA